MKKWLSIILMCMVWITSSIFASATNQEEGLVIAFNGEQTEYYSVFCDDTHYVPMRKVFEKMGASVFYRSRDGQIMALSRDGDIIRHIVGENHIVFNGEQKTVEMPSFSKDYETYIPIEMVSETLYPDDISYNEQHLNIQKYMFNSDYHKVIQDVLDLCSLSNFYPERFQRYIDFHAKMPVYSVQEAIARVNLGLDYPFYENVATIEHPDELLVLVNKYHQLPEGYAAYNLVNMSREYTVNDGKQYLLLAGAYEHYVQMAEAAEKEGLSMRVVSAYRTEDYQRFLYNNKLRTNGKIYADNYSARPGFSEHQTGLAVDINSTRVAFEYSAEFKWLQEHAHEYGYIMRYPKGKEWITGYAYEPWHYRFVGIEAAKIIYEEGITYEEFYAKYVSVNEFR
ncbi:MAG: D-alanyl-D-alanine carboxypeptidase family protein [Clostridia bacterium]|nr:D-alanyl-D-alanine carboxypeptidase family protein [Clostridia bacterium]